MLTEEERRLILDKIITAKDDDAILQSASLLENDIKEMAEVVQNYHSLQKENSALKLEHENLKESYRTKLIEGAGKTPPNDPTPPPNPKPKSYSFSSLFKEK